MKNGKAKTEPGEAFVKLPRHVLERPAVQRLGVNAWRVVLFLMLEHLRHGGRDNGYLKAPHRQLVAFGIGDHFVTRAIREAEAAGLVRCQRGGRRIPSLYALTWLPGRHQPARTAQPPPARPRARHQY